MITSIQVSVPSKTFLMGEYVVLQNGPGIVLTTAPRFQIKLTKSSSGKECCKMVGIDVQSPAGKLLGDNTKLFQGCVIEFIDEHKGLGGFGASSAQFLMVEICRRYLSDEVLDIADLFAQYYKYAWQGKGIPPSGVDVIAQLHGGVCYFDKRKQAVETYDWPFVNLDYCLIHTGNKLATHRHLEELTALSFEDFYSVVEAGRQSFRYADSRKFINAINEYAALLMSRNLVTQETKTILDKLAVTEILAAKGCGSMGSDVILVVYAKDNDDILKWLKQAKFNIITYGQYIEKGLQLNVT